MAKTTWREYEVPRQGGLQQMGEIVLFDDGAAQLSNKIYVRRSLIDNVQFAGGHVARRRIDRPNILEVVAPDGERYYFRYSWLNKLWYRQIIHQPHLPSRFREHLRRHGPVAAPVIWLAGVGAPAIGRFVLRFLWVVLLPLLPLIFFGLLALFFR